jgi:hypothetical protein
MKKKLIKKNKLDPTVLTRQTRNPRHENEIIQ